MALGSVNVLHGVKLPSAFIGQITDATVDGGIEALVNYSAGHPDPLFRSVRGEAPRVRFTSTQIATVLDNISQSGADFSSSNVDAYFRRATNFGKRAALNASTAERFRMQEAMGCWQRVSAAHQQDATIECEIYPVYDGSNLPLVRAGSQTVEGTPAASELFTLGPASINTTALTNLQSATLDLGLNVQTIGVDGELWPRHVHIEDCNPILEFDLFDIAGAWGSFHKVAVTAWSFALRKKSATGNVADGTSEHILFSGTSGICYVIESSGGGNARTTTKLRVELNAASSSADPITIDTTAAIS